MEENKIDLPTSILESMPPVPDVSKADRIQALVENIDIEEDGPFKACQIVKTDTSFCHLGIALNTHSIPERLRPYLVLFQELMFQSPLSLPSSDSSKKLLMDYQEVSKYASELFISHECGVGFGNSLFSASYLSQLLTLFVTSSPHNWERMIRFTIQVLMFTVFVKDRILSIAKNLLSNLVDVKRDGNAVLSAVVERVCVSKSFSTQSGSNDHSISIFKQESFLKHVVQLCKVCAVKYWFIFF